MKCPVCQNVNLILTDRQGVEIDYCPECRGVWLDRGELDKIIQRANAWDAERSGATPPHGDPVTHNQPGTRHGPGPRSRRDDDSVDEDYRTQGKRRKPFWLEIFD